MEMAKCLRPIIRQGTRPVKRQISRIISRGTIRPRHNKKIVVFCNAMMDNMAVLEDASFIDRYKASANSSNILDIAKIREDASKLTQFKKCPGGAALNTVRLLRFMGTFAHFFSAVGDDETAKELKRMLKERNVKAHFQTVSDLPTGECVHLLCNKRCTEYANIGASAKFNVDFLKEIEKSDPFLHHYSDRQTYYLTGFFLQGREEVCRYILENYIRGRHRLAINLSSPSVIEHNFDILHDILSKAFIIIGNEAEYAKLAEKMNCKNGIEAAENLLMMHDHATVCVITKGAEGVQVVTNFLGERYRPVRLRKDEFLAVPPRRFVDRTGVGDAFAAGFLQGYLQLMSLSDCVRLGMCLASLVITQVGCNVPGVRI